jgi:hypothetical protein
MAEFCVPILGFGDEQSPPTVVTWRDGTILCRGILGSLDAENITPVIKQPSDTNVISMSEFKEKRNAKEKPL